ncbi:hypothetical protein BCAR13_1510005 [Paraburkholderia caribensis]|nr:hypothetical protein BCAR13_1510005 [Paraburkholderia caribensis]
MPLGLCRTVSYTTNLGRSAIALVKFESPAPRTFLSPSCPVRSRSSTKFSVIPRFEGSREKSSNTFLLAATVWC